MAKRAKHLIGLKNFLAFFVLVCLLLAVAGHLDALFLVPPAAGTVCIAAPALRLPRIAFTLHVIWNALFLVIAPQAIRWARPGEVLADLPLFGAVFRRRPRPVPAVSDRGA